MKLTEKELEIMRVLWENEFPMSASEIIDSSEDRTWKETSVFTILNTLLKKGAIVLDHLRPTATRSAKVYRVAVTIEEYAALQVVDLNFNFTDFISAVMRYKSTES